MIAFWAAAALLSAAAAILILLRAARTADAEPADTASLFYRRQLSEIGDLADRGLIGADERKSAEAEAGRRLLAAADAPADAWTSTTSRIPILIAAIGAPALALAAYLLVGSPGLDDQPFSARLAQWRGVANPATLAPAEMAAVLEKLTAERPNDPQGFRFLAMAELAANNPAGATRALKRAIKLAPDRPDLWEMLGEAEVFRANDKLSDDAIQAFIRTRQLDPANATARFQLARAKIEAGDKAGGVAEWRALLADLRPDDRRRADLQAAIARAEGTEPPPPAAPQGLSGDQLTAVRGMVEGLAAKLQANPDSPEGWVRLVRAYSVLGDTAKRDAALKAARARYAGKADILQALTDAADAEPMK